MQALEAYIKSLRRGAALAAALPLTLQILAGAVGERRVRLAYEGSLALLLWDDILRLLLKRIRHRDELATRTWQVRPRIPINAQTKSRIK